MKLKWNVVLKNNVSEDSNSNRVSDFMMKTKMYLSKNKQTIPLMIK